MKTILVLTDFSPRANAAGEYATRIATELKANILLCHAIELSFPAGYEMPVPASYEDCTLMKEESLDKLERMRSELQRLSGNTAEFFPLINIYADFGTPEQVASDMIPEHDIILVVSGAHHSNLLTRFLTGSHTNTLLDSLECPVLLVPETAVFKSWSYLAYATDHTFDNLGVIKWLTNFAEPFSARIRVLHIKKAGYQHPDVYKKHVDDLKTIASQVHGALYYKEFLPGEALHKSLLETCRFEKNDMLAVVHKHYAFPESIFHSSISMKLANETDIPLLVFPNSFCEASETEQKESTAY